MLVPLHLQSSIQIAKSESRDGGNLQVHHQVNLDFFEPGSISIVTDFYFIFFSPLCDID